MLRHLAGQPLRPAHHPHRSVPREMADITKLPYARVKITFDLTCLITTAVITFVGVGAIRGLGIGTVVAACTMGKGISFIGSLLDKRLTFHSVLDGQRCKIRRQKQIRPTS